MDFNSSICLSNSSRVLWTSVFSVSDVYFMFHTIYISHVSGGGDDDVSRFLGYISS